MSHPPCAGYVEYKPPGSGPSSDQRSCTWLCPPRSTGGSLGSPFSGFRGAKVIYRMACSEAGATGCWSMTLAITVVITLTRKCDIKYYNH